MPYMYDHFKVEVEELEAKRKERETSSQRLDFMRKNLQTAGEPAQKKGNRLFQLKVLNKELQLTAKEKRKAIEEDAQKQKILNLNKWDLVRQRREEMLKYQRYLRFKISLVRKMITNMTLNRQMRVLFSNF